MNVNDRVTKIFAFSNFVQYDTIVDKSDYDPFLNELREKINLIFLR